jgi:hypothetical protein
MKTMKAVTKATLAFVSVVLIGQYAAADVSKEELKSISTPDKIKTPIGELKFFDGVPTDDTIKKVYDNLDRMRGVQVFLNTLPGASMYRLRAGNAKIGADKSNKVAISSQLLNSKSLYLTANTSTLYSQMFLDTEADGPTVIEIPPGMLGMINDSWFRYVTDLGVIGIPRAAPRLQGRRPQRLLRGETQDLLELGFRARFHCKRPRAGSRDDDGKDEGLPPRQGAEPTENRVHRFFGHLLQHHLAQ